MRVHGYFVKDTWFTLFLGDVEPWENTEIEFKLLDLRGDSIVPREKDRTEKYMNKKGQSVTNTLIL